MPEGQSSPERGELLRKLDWSKLLEEALTMPGSMGNVYNRFYNYSFLNQIYLQLQGVREPINTYDRWKAMGRQVKKGSKAKAILRPLMRKSTNDDGEEVGVLTGFKFVSCLFTVSETEGDELPEVQPPQWRPDVALDELGIEEVPFEQLDGNIHGYSYERKMAVNPLAPDKLKTRFHELAHIVFGHTAPGKHSEYLSHRGVMEFQAEAVAYLAMHELEVEEPDSAAESRAYIQDWLSGATPDDSAIRGVFVAADQILRAGGQKQ
jgi:hypothetical protein